MNPTLAAFNLVRDYPGGATTLGPLIGKNPATLSHEVNPHYPTAKLGLEDAVRLSMLTRDLRIASAFASEVNCMLLPLPDPGVEPSSFQVLATMAREFAELVARVTEASADGHVTPNEARAVEREASELVASVQATVRHLNSMVREPSRMDSAKAVGAL
jgi:hypothetical protein